MTFEKGEKVHYDPEHGNKENGIVKGMHPTDPEIVFVVYKCNNEWYRFEDFTANGTDIHDLKLGWV